MKFQKSFFWFQGTQSLIEQCVYFFTKATWPDGKASRSLVGGSPNFQSNTIFAPRNIETLINCDKISDLIDRLEHLAELNAKYDFIFIDLRMYIQATQDLDEFLAQFSGRLFKALRTLLSPMRYCCLLVNPANHGGVGFPSPWSVALSSRGHLRLRDEKIGIADNRQVAVYNIILQAQDDERPVRILNSPAIVIENSDVVIPSWIIPKPPPRKKNEVLHPAKYPETLVNEFIRLFTNPGDNVFDPMVGTGSSVVAACLAGRNGYGLDLNSEYVEISRKRVQRYCQPRLFKDFQKLPQSLIAEGDASNLENIKDLAGTTFQYVVTSPPYWSMLTNPGSENQEMRRKKSLPLTYSEDKRDLSNIDDYGQFLQNLVNIYERISVNVAENGHLTVVVKNIKRNHILYTLAWDLVAELSKPSGEYAYLGTTLWCQDDVGIKPFAVGIHWVSNILHQYCLHFKKRSR